MILRKLRYLNVLILIACLFSFLFANDKDENKETFDPLILKINDTTECFVSTFSKYNNKVIKTNGSYYFNFTSTLGRLTESKQLEVFRIPKGENLYSNRIRSIELINDTLWVGASKNGIWLFDIFRKKFIDQIIVSRNERGQINGNLKFTFDRKHNILWVPSSRRLDMYSKSTNKWLNLTDLYTDFDIGEFPGRQSILLDNENVWVISSAHAKSKGGILNYNYSTNEWKAYVEDLKEKNSFPFTRYDQSGVWATTEYLWVMTSFGGNSIANLRLALLNKKNRHWTYFHPNDFSDLGPLLNKLENCKKQKIIRPLFKRSKRYIKFYKSIVSGEYSEKHIKYFSKTDSNKVSNSIQFLEKQVSQNHQDLCPSHDHKFVTRANKIFQVNGQDEIDSIAFTDFAMKYEKVFAVHNNKVVIGSNNGFIILDLRTKKITKFSEHLRRYPYNEMSKARINNDKIYISDYSEIGACEDNPSAIIHLYEIDLKNDNLFVFHSERFDSEKRLDPPFKVENGIRYRFNEKVLQVNGEEVEINKLPLNIFDNKKYFVDLEGIKIIK
ncbi:MAG: hypothetical protein D8M58_05005 [Calditrichaeota bacterium]|nr:MAG: hypothetical protein DWQ03_02070 [Calditrichota bacterium]MBL1204732.1 hypothetical protein [Calditrichota bacterium]NOG44560.1 hypothetical protein [Calditrichota bacterium]